MREAISMHSERSSKRHSGRYSVELTIGTTRTSGRTDTAAAPPPFPTGGGGGGRKTFTAVGHVLRETIKLPSRPWST